MPVESAEKFRDRLFNDVSCICSACTDAKSKEVEKIQSRDTASSKAAKQEGYLKALEDAAKEICHSCGQGEGVRWVTGFWLHGGFKCSASAIHELKRKAGDAE